METGVRSTVMYKKALGCLMGGLIGDAMGAPGEGKTFSQIEEKFGWIADFSTDGTDDTIMKILLAEALTRSGGHATLDDWAAVWVDKWSSIFGQKVNKFFYSVLHTAAKLKLHSIPRMAALGNMPSSSSAMCISPIGIINACNPRQAALQTYNMASLIHVHDVGFCQDGAVAMAAAVAEAFKPGATVESVLDATTRYLLPLSGQEMRELIERVLAMARAAGEFKSFRKAVYDDGSLFRRIGCDSRETIPITIGLFFLAGGDVEKCVTYGANFGRDADTISCMCGAMAGALQGVDGIKPEWVEKVRKTSEWDNEALAAELAATAVAKAREAEEALRLFQAVAGS